MVTNKLYKENDKGMCNMIRDATNRDGIYIIIEKLYLTMKLSDFIYIYRIFVVRMKTMKMRWLYRPTY
jgi:glycerol-3-phosphate responsive antiterminator